LGGRTTKNIVAVILQELIALERHWDFWSGSVCGAPSLASPRKALAFGFSPISGDGGMGNLPYSTSRTTTNDERNLALSSF
jgi:hypothetical protein